MLSDLKSLRIEDYDYPLPDDRIARYPLARRDHSRLLALQGESLGEHRFLDLPSLLPQDTMLVFNDTRVIHARLFFRKETGATIEVFCLEPHAMAISEAFEQRGHCTWTCLIGNNKKWKEGPLTLHFTSRQAEYTLAAHSGRPLVAVGTTTVRTLESLYWFGVQLQQDPDLPGMHIRQWDPYTLPSQGLPYADAYGNILRWMERHGTDRLAGATQLMIAPGYEYKVIRGLVTNFHQPKSTLLLLVSALVGDRWREVYRYALAHGFRFLSYGDSCLFLP